MKRGREGSDRKTFSMDEMIEMQKWKNSRDPKALEFYEGP